MKIKTAVIEKVGDPFNIQELELRDPGPNEVLVKIVACGVCHTDAGLQHGEYPTPFPVVAGHEGSGIVEKVGDSVLGIKEGDQVILAAGHKEVTLNLPMEVFIPVRTIQGSIEGNVFPQDCIPKLIDYFKAGKFPLDKLVTFYPFEKINEAFADSKSGVAVKPILRMS